VGAERVLLILGGEVDRRIDRHLAQLVGRRDALRCMVGANGLDEHLRERLSFVGQVMVRERAGLIGILEPDQPPRAARRDWPRAMNTSSAGSTRHAGPRSRFHCFAKIGSISLMAVSSMCFDSLMTAIVIMCSPPPVDRRADWNVVASCALGASAMPPAAEPHCANLEHRAGRRRRRPLGRPWAKLALASSIDSPTSASSDRWDAWRDRVDSRALAIVLAQLLTGGHPLGDSAERRREAALDPSQVAGAYLARQPVAPASTAHHVRAATRTQTRPSAVEWKRALDDMINGRSDALAEGCPYPGLASFAASPRCEWHRRDAISTSCWPR